MTRTPRQNLLCAWELDPRDRTPIYRQIYLRVRTGITEGTLKPAQRLASARTLASQLGVARGTVDAAYAMLAAEGYIEAHGASGTIVGTHLAALSNRSRRRPGSSRRARTLSWAAYSTRDPTVSPFQSGMPALDAFPTQAWARLAARCARQWPSSAMVHQHLFGYRPLREAIAGYLAVARGVSCSPQQVVITRGYQATLALIARALLKAGDAVWFEEPGYFNARSALDAAGARLIPVPVDSQGIDVATGIARSNDARLAIVTPSHQAPLGVSLDLHRRLALLSWAGKADAWILEDDYDGEFRYQSRPLPALQSLDRQGRVLYAGTFSKVLFPGLRLAYLVLPDRLVDPFMRILYLFYQDATRLEPAVVAEFMNSGHFGRHIRRMRQLYGERREALALALERRLGQALSVELQAGGMHLIGSLKKNARDSDLARSAAAQGLAAGALSTWYMRPRDHHALLLSFTNIPVDMASSAVGRLAQAIGF